MFRKISSGNDFNDLLGCDGAYGPARWVKLKLIFKALIETFHLLLELLALAECFQVLGEPISL